jgi:hypothetical protein
MSGHCTTKYVRGIMSDETPLRLLPQKIFLLGETNYGVSSSCDEVFFPKNQNFGEHQTSQLALVTLS